MIAIATLMLMTAADARILVHGHRGARSVRPENTLPAFEYAIAQGVEVLELDMAVTRDNVVVVSHDAEMNPKHCVAPDNSATRVIREMTLAELKRWDCGVKPNPDFPKQQPVPGTRVPTLDEVFQMAARHRVEFNIETKIFRDKPQLTPPPAEFARLVLQVVRKHKLESRVILQSFDNRTLIEMAKLEPGIRRSMLVPTGPMDAMKNWVEACREAANATIISPHFLTVTPERVAEAHKAGLQVVPWTANDAGQWQKLVDSKVDAIITDDPAELIAWLKAKGLR
jgi:glycerophosphoryl diester phosphodiesterase